MVRWCGGAVLWWRKIYREMWKITWYFDGYHDVQKSQNLSWTTYREGQEGVWVGR